jgi:YVTN family beta-propeller protein
MKDKIKFSAILASFIMIIMLVSIAGAAPFGYVPNFGNNTVSIIDTATNTVTATVPVGLNPYAVAINPTGTRVYVTNYGDDVVLGTVSVIDTATNTVTATVPVEKCPVGISADSTGTMVYVANAASHTVSVIDTATNSVVATVPVGRYPFAIGRFIASVPIKLTPMIIWSNPADILSGTPLSSTQLNATASVPGNFVYAPSSGTLLNAGTQTLHVDFTPTDTANYNTVSKDVTINVLTPVQKIQQMNTIIQGLVTSGKLKKGQADVLKVTLGGVKASLDAGKTKVATVELNAFIVEVKAYIKNGILSSKDGQTLIDGANAVINASKT